MVLPNAVMLGEVSRMLSEGHSVVIMTKGNSMLPFIVGERDSVELIKKDSYGIGDIVLAQVAEGHWVLHRLVGMDGESVTLKGDGNLVGTEKCRLQDIAGSVRTIIRPKKKVDCGTAVFASRSERWRALPYTLRRIVLGIFRRLI